MTTTPKSQGAAIDPTCSGCGNRLQKVTQSPNSMLNAEQFDAARAGDWFCSTCPGNQARTGYRYFWEKDLLAAAIDQAPTDLQSAYRADYHYLLGLRAGWNLSQQQDVAGFNAALASRQISLDAAKAEIRAAIDQAGAPAAWMVGLEVFKTLAEAQKNIRNPYIVPVPLYLAAPAGDTQQASGDDVTYTVNGQVLRPLEYIAYLHDQLAQQASDDARDAARLDFIEAECLTVECVNLPTPGGDDADVGFKVIQYHMAKPHERDIGFGSTPRAAIDAAMGCASQANKAGQDGGEA